RASASGYSPILGRDPKAEVAPTLVLPPDVALPTRRLIETGVARTEPSPEAQAPDSKSSHEPDPEATIQATLVQEPDEATQVYILDQNPEEIESLDPSLFPVSADVRPSRDIARE